MKDHLATHFWDSPKSSQFCPDNSRRDRNGNGCGWVNVFGLDGIYLLYILLLLLIIVAAGGAVHKIYRDLQLPKHSQRFYCEHILLLHIKHK